MWYYENNKKQSKGPCLQNQAWACWPERTRSCSTAIAAFPTPPTAFHHPAFKAVHLFFLQKGETCASKINEGKWDHSGMLLQNPALSFPQHLEGKRRNLFVTVLMHATHFHLSFLSCHTQFYTFKEIFVSQGLIPQRCYFTGIWVTVLFELLFTIWTGTTRTDLIYSSKITQWTTLQSWRGDAP